MRIRLAVAIAALAVGIGAGTLGQQPRGLARFVGSVALPSDPPILGGFSGIELGPNGRQMVLISDRGRVVHGQLSRENGTLFATLGPPIRFQDRNGRRLNGKGNDAEGLAIGPNGTLFVSFEGIHRILAYHPGQSRAFPLPRHPSFRKLSGNGGLEALAADAQGFLYALPERPWTRRRDIPVFRLDHDGWSEWAPYPRQRGFLPVGADFGPDGRLYVLERHFKGLGFASLVRSFHVDDNGLSDPQTHLQTPERFHGNLEGLSVWRDAQGQIRLTLVADDNFLRLLPNAIVEYVLPNSLAKMGNQD